MKHLFVEGLWRSVERKAGDELIRELAAGRYTSFPFISPDTFRALADIVIEDAEVKRREKLSARHILYFDLAEVEGTEATYQELPALGLLDEVLTSIAAPPVLIMSHGDFAPSAQIMSDLESRCHRVYSINILQETEKTKAIPLGLENLYRNRNGRLADYHDAFEHPDTAERTQMVFAAFSAENNRPIRSKLLEQLGESRFPSPRGRLTPEKYRDQVRRTKFVLSPPGRGFDCHRTWEAIYLGAIPVVLEGSIPPSFESALPLHPVSSYSDFLYLADNDLLRIYEDAIARPRDLAFMPKWTSHIWEVSNEG
jgi:hypothetical protein